MNGLTLKKAGEWRFDTTQIRDRMKIRSNGYFRIRNAGTNFIPTHAVKPQDEQKENLDLVKKRSVILRIR